VLDHLLRVRAPALLRGGLWADAALGPSERAQLQTLITTWAERPQRTAADRAAILRGGDPATPLPFELPFDNAVR
jgi:uncharacterized lipoprotein YbaY